MSANDCIETVQECLQRGASHYILKPVTKKEVQAIWQHAFRSRPAARTPSSTAQPNDVDSSTPQAVSAQAPPHAPHSPDAEATSPRVVSLGSGVEVPLNDVLESHMLPWQQRLVTFCHLLRSSILAFDAHGPGAPAERPPFRSPCGVYVMDGGLVSARSDSGPAVPHPATRHYRAPGPAGAREAKATPDAQAECVYALGVLLFELAAGPAGAAARAERLAALPSLPVELLTSWPDVAVLVLRMTAARPRDRPPLADVAADGAVACTYCALEARLDAGARAAATVDAAAQFSFLTLAETVQRRRVQAIGALLARLEDDLAQVRRVPAHHSAAVMS
jgi:CheY-like chemotaxis protein